MENLGVGALGLARRYGISKMINIIFYLTFEKPVRDRGMWQMLELRQEVDGRYPHSPSPPTPPHISRKRLGDYSLLTNSRRRMAGQLREESGPCPDDIFLKVRRPP